MCQQTTIETAQSSASDLSVPSLTLQPVAQTVPAEKAASAVTAAKAETQIQIHRVNLKEFLRAQADRFLTVEFVKQDGSYRKLTGRFQVRKHLKGGDNKTVAIDRPYMTIFDVQAAGYRTINLETVSKVRACGMDLSVIG